MNRAARRKLRAALASRAELSVTGGRIRAAYTADCGCYWHAEGSSRARALDGLADNMADDLQDRHDRQLECGGR